MDYTSAIIIFLAILAIAAYAMIGSRYIGREKYGPPPGMARALTLRELGDRGWAGWPAEYEADTASSISHMIMRSA